MKMLLTFKSRTLLALLIFAMAAPQLIACSSAPTKPDEEPKEVKRAEIEELAEEMGMSVDTVRAFQQALAELDEKKPDSEKVEGLLKEVVSAEPDFAEAHYNLGVVYSNRGDYERALEHLEKAREIDPEVLDHTVALAQAYAVTERYSRASTLFEEVVARQPNNLTAKNNLAVLALREGEDEKAMQFVRDVLREDDQNVGARKTLGLIYRKRDNLSLAKFVLNEAIELLAEDEEVDADLHNNLGLVLMMEDNVPGAVAQFETAIAADPNYLESRLNLGAILIEYLDYERAAEQFAEAVRIAPAHCTARLGKAAADYGLNEPEDAVANFEHYIAECDADHVSSHERLATLYEGKLQDPRAAAEYYEKLLELVDDEEKRANYQAMANFLRSQVDSDDQKAPEEAEDTQEDQQEDQGVEDDSDDEAAEATTE